MPAIRTQQNFKSVPYSIGISCNRARGLTRIHELEKHKFLRFMGIAKNDPAKQCLIIKGSLNSKLRRVEKQMKSR